jgi:hypothetical protein
MNSYFQYIFFLIGFSCFPLIQYAQEKEEEKYKIIEERVDFLLDINESGDADFTTLFEQLEVFYNKPINLNSADRYELAALGLLNDLQINYLLQHIENHGKLLSFEELQSIRSFDLESIRLIQPFTSVSGDLDRISLSPEQLVREGSSSLFLRYSRTLEIQEGYRSISPEELEENPNSRYLGDANKYFARYRFTYANNVSIGFTAEKDPGEEFLSGSQQRGFDFYSAHFFLQNFGHIRQLAIGDFQAQFGQGLTFWSGLAFGRSPSVFTLKRNAPKLRPYTSVQEDLFLRGGGATLQFAPFEVTLFYSSQEVDANISGIDSLDNQLIISSLSENGFHRTEGELADKNVVRSQYVGGNISFEKRNFQWGATFVHNELDASLQATQRVYNQFSLLDNRNSNWGTDFSYLYRNLNLFGEYAQSIDGGAAYTFGALVALDSRLSLGVQHRNFDRDFRPIQSNALGESSNNTNERGTFFGIEAQLNKALSLSAYADRFIFPWLRFQTDAPSEGKRLFAQLTYKPSKRLEFYLRYRQRERERNNTAPTEGLDEIVTENNKHYRFHLSYQVSKTITVKSRVEVSNYQLGENQKERGILLYQDISYKRLSFPLSFSLRYALFDTDSYNSRIYAYESDVLYSFSIPAFSGRGSRFYVVTKYHISRGIDLWLRYAQSYYTDRDSIGSGKEEIYGNTKSEIKAQLRFKF